MTNELTQVREDLKALLTAAEFFAFTTVPERAVPPMAYVAPGFPYMSYDGASYGGGVIVRCNVVVIAKRGTNDVAAEALDDMVLRVIDAVDGSEDFLVSQVDIPGQISINGQLHLGVSIEVQREIQRG